MTYRFLGGGYIPGVPARDLTDDEAREFRVTGSALYERARPERPKKQAEPLPQGEVLPEAEEETGDE